MKRNRLHGGGHLIFCESQSRPGKFYYFDSKTGQSYWTKPGEHNTDKIKLKVDGNVSKKSNTNSLQDGYMPESSNASTNAHRKVPTKKENNVNQNKKKGKNNIASKRMADLQKNLKDGTFDIKQRITSQSICKKLVNHKRSSAITATDNAATTSKCINPINTLKSELKKYTIPMKQVHKADINFTTPLNEGTTARKIIQANRNKRVTSTKADELVIKNNIEPVNNLNAIKIKHGRDCDKKINSRLLSESDDTSLRNKKPTVCVSFSNFSKSITKQENAERKVDNDDKFDFPTEKIDPIKKNNHIKDTRNRINTTILSKGKPTKEPTKRKIKETESNIDFITQPTYYYTTNQLNSEGNLSQPANKRLSNLKARLSEEISKSSVISTGSLVQNNIYKVSKLDIVHSGSIDGNNSVSPMKSNDKEVVNTSHSEEISRIKSRKCDLSGKSQTNVSIKPNEIVTNKEVVPNTQLKNAANTRLVVLRSRLSDEAIKQTEEEKNEDVIMENKLDHNNEDEMEWETILDEINLVRGKTSVSINTTDPIPVFSQNEENIKENFHIVVDTNVFISDLKLIKFILSSSFSACLKKPIIALPWRVLMELDFLKLKREEIKHKAREAADYIRKQLSSNTRIKGQSLKDANNHIYPCEGPDDEILNYCLQLAEKESSVILLSNDKILSSKSLVNDIKAMTSMELNSLILNSDKSFDDQEEIVEIINTKDDSLWKIYHNLKTLLKKFLSKLLKTEMRSLYGNLWTRIVYKLPPWTYDDVVRCILKHWVAVFSGKFSANLKNLLHNLLEYDKDEQDESFTQENMEKFAGVMLQIFQNIEAIDDYVDSAKENKARAIEICKKCSVVKTSNFQENSNSALQSLQSNLDCKVSQAFHIIWTFFSSYCVQIASFFNVIVSQALMSETTPFSDGINILDQAPSVYKQLVNILSAVSGVVRSINEQRCEIGFEISKLNDVICETVTGLGQASMCTTVDEVHNYCFHNKDILEEGREKFSLLYDILNECQKKYSEISS